MRKENVDIVSGVITKIERINGFLSFVTLEHLDLSGSTIMPFYSGLSQKYMDRYVEFKNVERGLFFKTIEQEISASDFSTSVELTAFQAKAVLNSYRTHQYQLNP